MEGSRDDTSTRIHIPPGIARRLQTVSQAAVHHAPYSSTRGRTSRLPDEDNAEAAGDRRIAIPACGSVDLTQTAGRLREGSFRLLAEQKTFLRLGPARRKLTSPGYLWVGLRMWSAGYARRAGKVKER